MRLELLEKLSDGQLAEVWIGRFEDVSGPELASVRRLHRSVAKVEGLRDLLAEASASLATLNHDNLCRHIGFFQGGEDTYWLSRRSEGFDLETVLTRLATREVHLTSLRSLQIGLDFVKGLRVLHEQGLVHGGPSPRFVLVGYDGVARLDGAGFESAILSCRELKQKARNGRASHLAPEVLQGRKPTFQSDVFSAAAVVYTLLTGRMPLGDNPRAGAGMSVRNASIEPPSKLDRTLPYSCDALFEKALALPPLGRHQSGAEFFEAVKRLRAAMLKGPDEGRQGVREFIENMYPNEAIVPGKPGTLQRPPLGEEILLTPVTGGGGSSPAQASDQADPDALARIAAWEAKFGSPGQGESAAAAQPPPLPPRQEEGPTAARSRASKTPSDSVVVDWSGLSGEAAEPAPVPGPSDWDRIPTQVSAPPDEVLEEPLQESSNDDFVTEPELPIEVVEDEPFPPLVPDKESDSPETTDEEDVLPIQSPARDTTPQGELALNTTQMRMPVWRRPLGLLAILLLLVLGVVAVVLASNSSGPEEKQPIPDAGQPARDATPVGFLSINTDGPARVTLDGEVLPGLTPLTHKLVRAGRHRLVLESEKAGRLFDETVTIQPGEHRTIRVVVATAKATETPRPATSIGEKKEKTQPKVKRKRRIKKHRRRKKRRVRKRP